MVMYKEGPQALNTTNPRQQQQSSRGMGRVLGRMEGGAEWEGVLRYLSQVHEVLTGLQAVLPYGLPPARGQCCLGQARGAAQDYSECRR